MLRLPFKWSRKVMCEECTKFYLRMDLNMPISLPHFILELFSPIDDPPTKFLYNDPTILNQDFYAS